jgi:hypothetical protein
MASSEIHSDLHLDASFDSIDIDTNSIVADEAPFIRQALVRAQAMRLVHSNPGDAYLQGVTDALNYKHLQDLVHTFELGRTALTDTDDSAVA